MIVRLKINAIGPLNKTSVSYVIPEGTVCEVRGYYTDKNLVQLKTLDTKETFVLSLEAFKLITEIAKDGYESLL